MRLTERALVSNEHVRSRREQAIELDWGRPQIDLDTQWPPRYGKEQNKGTMRRQSRKLAKLSRKEELHVSKVPSYIKIERYQL